MNNSSKTSYYNEVSSTETSQLSEVAPRDSDQETPRPQLSFKSNDDEILREVCLNNGINYKKLYLEGPETTVLEMFFSGYPRLIGMHHFPNLTTLTVIGQSVTRLEGLSDLPNLDELWIAECQLTRIEGLDHCTSLTKLYLYGNRISVIENIHHLINIKILWLNNNLIHHIENLHTLTNLRELNIAENLIEKIGNALVYNIHLEELNLSGNPLWSLRDLTCLVKLQKLTRLSLKDPLYHPCPVSHLCNFSTHVLYHLPKLTCLDTLDITSKQLADLAEGTVNKKKMFYNMRAKTIRRNMSDLLMRLEDTSKELLELPHSKLKVINFVIKEMEREIMMETEITTEENEKESEKYKSSFKAKLQMIKQKKSKWEKKALNIESYAKLSETRVRQMADMMVKRLLVELETGGNVRFEDGLATDPWFSSCHDLVLSRFCAYDYRDLGVTGIKIHRITRIHNRMLRTRFDKSIVAQTESNKGEYYPGSKNTAYKKSLEYLFWMSDPAMEGGLNESFRIPEEGFMNAETYLKLKRDGAVPLSNSISLADRRRINYCLKTAVDADQEIDSCPFRYGHLIVAKAHLGKSVIAKDDLLITTEHYPKMDSVFKPRKKCIPNEKKAEEDGCECSSRQCEWYIFNSNLVLPEYIIDFEYITRLKSQCPFQHLNEDLLSEQPQKNSIPVVWNAEDDSDSDSDIIKMEPEIKSRQRVSLLTERVILQAAHATALDKITVLNLHGNGITKLRPLQALSKLDVLIVSFNELTRLDDLSNMQITLLDASFNKIYTLDGMKGMTKLKELNVSWNKLVNTREELSILRKHLSYLHVLDFRNNPWLKARDLRLRAIGRLRNLEVLDGKKVEDEEAALALRCAAGSRISQLSLLTHSRTDSTVPRSLSLGDSAHVITMISRNRPLKTCETDTKWYSQITTLNLDNQHITKLSNLERLENLLWASFNNNDLTRIEGLDSCTQLQELSLTNNCIAHLEGLSKLSCIQKLDLSHNCLTSIDTGVLANMLSLASLSLESNRLTSLAGLQKCNALTELYIGNNTISNIREVFLLKSLSNLVILDMYGNPMVTAVENYRLFVIYHLRSLKALDGSAIAQRNIRKEMALYQKTQATLDLLLLDLNNSASQEIQDCTMAKDLFGGRLTPDFIAERLGHSIFSEVRELDLPNCGIRTVDLGSELFVNLRSVNLEHNNLLSFSGLIYLVNLRVLCLNHNHIESLLPKPKQSQLALKKPALSTTSKNSDNLPASGTPLLENLEVLHLGYNGIKDMTALQLNRLPSLKALFLQGNEITKVEGLDGLHDLRELVLDKNKIKQLSEFSFANQWNLQELHMEENRLRDLSGLSCLENLMRLYLGSNRITEQMDLEKLDSMRYLTEISLINNPVSRRMIHRIILIHRLPRLTVIDGITITDEERSRTELHFSDQVLQLAAPPVVGVESGFPGLGVYKPSVQVKVTNMQLNSASMWGNTTFSEEDNGQRARGKRPTRDPTRQPFGLSGGNISMAQNNNSNSRIQYTYLNQTTYNGQTPEYMESISRLNQQRGNKR